MPSPPIAPDLLVTYELLVFFLAKFSPGCCIKDRIRWGQRVRKHASDSRRDTNSVHRLWNAGVVTVSYATCWFRKEEEVTNPRTSNSCDERERMRNASGNLKLDLRRCRLLK
jgi:hypothetical protein